MKFYKISFFKMTNFIESALLNMTSIILLIKFDGRDL